jgi:hypothetical protein
MIDNIHFLEESPQLGPVADIAACKMDIWCERLRISGGEVIDPADLVSFTGKVVCKG